MTDILKSQPTNFNIDIKIDIISILLANFNIDILSKVSQLALSESTTERHLVNLLYNATVKRHFGNAVHHCAHAAIHKGFPHGIEEDEDE